MSITDIGRALGLHKSTVHRLLNSLLERGYVEKGVDSRSYRLGPGFIRISSSYLNSIELKTEAEPHMMELSRLLGQTIFLAVRQGSEVVYIDKVEQSTSLRRYAIIGRRSPLYCTSLGKALLLDSSDDRIRELLGGVPFVRKTRHTLPDLNALLDDLAQARMRGWSSDDQENEAGVQCIGAPIYDYRGKIMAAISTAWNIGYSSRCFEDITGPMLKTAGAISQRLGYFIKASVTERAGAEIV